MIRITTSLLIATALLPLPGEAQEATLTPVPAGYLAGNSLTVQDSNFAVAAPGPAWEWLQLSAPGIADGSAFVCRDTVSDTRVTISVMETDTRGLDIDKFGQGFLSGVTQKLEAQGWTVADADIEPTSFPLPGSMRFSSTARRADGTTGHSRGFLVKADRIYAIQEFTAEAVETPALQAVAKSFRLLEEPKQYAPPPLSGIYVFLLVLAWGLGALVNRFAGRLVINGALVAGVLIVVAAGIIIVRLAGGLSAEQLGFRVGEPVLPLLVAGWGARRYQRKKEEASASLVRPRPPARRYVPGSSRDRRPGTTAPRP